MKFREFLSRIFKRKNQKLLNEGPEGNDKIEGPEGNDEIASNGDDIKPNSASEYVSKLQEETKEAMQKKAREERIDKILELSNSKEFFKYLITSGETGLKLPKEILANPRALDMISGNLAWYYETDRLSNVGYEEKYNIFAKNKGILSAKDREEEYVRKGKILSELSSYMSSLSGKDGVRMPDGSSRYMRFDDTSFCMGTRGCESIKNGYGHNRYYGSNERYVFNDFYRPDVGKGFKVSYSNYDVEADKNVYGNDKNIEQFEESSLRYHGVMSSLPSLGEANAIKATSDQVVRYFDENQIEERMLHAKSEIDDKSRSARFSATTRGYDGDLVYTRKEFTPNNSLEMSRDWIKLNDLKLANNIEGGKKYRVALASGYDRSADTLKQRMDELDICDDHQIDEIKEEPSLAHYRLLWNAASRAKYVTSQNMLKYFPVLKDMIPKIIDENGKQIPRDLNHNEYKMPEQLERDDDFSKS